MRRCLQFVALLVTLALFNAPALADHENLKAGDQAIAFDAAYSNPDGGDSMTDLSGTWYKYISDNHRVGVNLLYLDQGSMDGGGTGPSYDYLFRPRSADQHWRIVIGGDLAYLTGDLDQAADGVAITRLGIERTIGSGSAIRVMSTWVKTINEQDSVMAEQIEGVGISIGILLGIQRATP